MVGYFKHNLLGKENNHGHYFQNHVLLFKKWCVYNFFTESICMRVRESGRPRPIDWDNESEILKVG
jgi:hypothetical protein